MLYTGTNVGGAPAAAMKDEDKGPTHCGYVEAGDAGWWGFRR